MVILKGADLCEAAAVPQGSGSDLAWGRRGEATIGPALMVVVLSSNVCSVLSYVVNIHKKPTTRAEIVYSFETVEHFSLFVC